jgi:hypothetical protein
MPPSKEWTVARDLLKKDLKEGRISSDLPSAKEVYEMRSEYKAVPWQRFRDNLRNLRKKFVELKDRAKTDSAAVANDRNLFPVDEGQNVGFAYPRFGGSEAERLLKLDVSNGEHKKMKPKELKLTRPEYEPFPPCVFAKHIHQELRERRAKSYWLAKKKNDGW